MTSRRFAALSFAFFLIAAPAAAQQDPRLTAGVRAGASLDPDQFYFGGHVETRELAESMSFRPNLEVGIGNDVTTITLNFELAYKFPTSRPWRPYVAFGPALNIYNTDLETVSRGGFNIGGGVQHRGGLFGDVNFGTIDSPDVKFGIGYRF